MKPENTPAPAAKGSGKPTEGGSTRSFCFPKVFCRRPRTAWPIRISKRPLKMDLNPSADFPRRCAKNTDSAAAPGFASVFDWFLENAVVKFIFYRCGAVAGERHPLSAGDACFGKAGSGIRQDRFFSCSRRYVFAYCRGGAGTAEDARGFFRGFPGYRTSMVFIKVISGHCSPIS